MTDTTENTFIEVKKIVSDRESGVNIMSKEHVINVADIHSFRPWKKGKNDVEIRGEMTFVILKGDSVDGASVMANGGVKEVTYNKSGVRTLLIEEGYKAFMYRLSLKAVVKDLEKKLHDIA